MILIRLFLYCTLVLAYSKPILAIDDMNDMDDIEYYDEKGEFVVQESDASLEEDFPERFIENMSKAQKMLESTELGKKTLPVVAEKDLPKTLPEKKRGLAQILVNRRQGMKVLKANCKMYDKPESVSTTLINLRAGKKLWLEPSVSGWWKGFRKSGIGFIPEDCVK